MLAGSLIYLKRCISESAEAECFNSHKTFLSILENDSLFMFQLCSLKQCWNKTHYYHKQVVKFNLRPWKPQPLAESWLWTAWDFNMLVNFLLLPCDFYYLFFLLIQTSTDLVQPVGKYPENAGFFLLYLICITYMVYYVKWAFFPSHGIAYHRFNLKPFHWNAL